MRFADKQATPPTMEILLQSTAFALALLAPAEALAEPGPRSPAGDGAAMDPLDHLVEVRVEIDGGSEIADQLQAATVEALAEAEVEPTLPGGAPLEIVVAPDPRELGAYRIVVSHRGERIHAWSCPCSGDELRADLRAKAVEAWDVARRPLLVATADEHEERPAPSPEAEPTNRRKPSRGFGLWVAGMTTTAVGASLVLGMSALLVIDKTTDYPAQPVTYGVLGAGAALGAAGVPMWIVGRRRLRTTASLGPASHGRGLVFSLRGRF